MAEPASPDRSDRLLEEALDEIRALRGEVLDQRAVLLRVVEYSRELESLLIQLDCRIGELGGQIEATIRSEMNGLVPGSSRH